MNEEKNISNKIILTIEKLKQNNVKKKNQLKISIRKFLVIISIPQRN